MKTEDLMTIVDENPDLFPVEMEASPIQTEEERMIAGFEEINQFVDQENHEPGSFGDFSTLQARLDGIRQNLQRRELLMPYDRHGLLSENIAVSSIEEALAQDDMGLLEDNTGIFDLKFVSQETKGNNVPDYIANRKRCKDFHLFEEKFKDCRADLKSNLRILKEFSDQSNSIREVDVQVGRFYYLYGVMVYIAEIGEMQKRRGRNDARLRCIFENGTENNMLMQSLLTALNKRKKNSYLITHRYDSGGLLKGNNEDASDTTGYIYVLQSKSKEPIIRDLKNLYKIGYCTIPVSQRIMGAKSQPAYLMAEVNVVLECECHNMNPQKTEKFLHKFFEFARLDVELDDGKGGFYKPQEWFIVPLIVIEQAVDKLMDGSITGCYYDINKQTIVEQS